MKYKLLLYCIYLFFIISAGWWIWGSQEDRNIQRAHSNTRQSDVTYKNVEKQSNEVPEENSEISGSAGMSRKEISNTPIIKIKLIPVNGADFVARRDPLSPDHKHWNKSKDLYLMVYSVWFDLYDSQNRKIFRFPNHINVDASGKPGAHDRARGDIKWQWADDLSVIGVQQIIQTGGRVIPKGLEGEFSELPPDTAKIYLYDVKKLNSVYELVPPDMPKGMIVRIEGVSNDGSLSLAALSPEAYNHGDDYKNDPNQYKYLGEYKYTK